MIQVSEITHNPRVIELYTCGGFGIAQGIGQIVRMILWLVFGGIGLIAAILVVHALWRRLNKDNDTAGTDTPTTPPPKTCIKCGYIIDNLPENRCPECGFVFDPNSPWTFRGGASARRRRGMPTWLIVVLVIIAIPTCCAGLPLLYLLVFGLVSELAQ